LALSVGKNQMCNLRGGFFFLAGFFSSLLVANVCYMFSGVLSSQTFELNPNLYYAKLTLD